MKTYLREVRDALRTKVGQDTQLVYLSQIVNAAIGFILNVFLIRHLSTEDYGLFSLFISVFTFLSSWMQLGWVDTYVRFGARFKQEGWYSELRRGFFLKLILGALGFSVLGMGLSPWLSTQVYKRPEFLSYLYGAILCGFILLIHSFWMADLQVWQRFRRFFWVQSIGTALRLVLVLLLFGWGFRSLTSVSTVYILVPGLMLLLGWLAGDLRFSKSRAAVEIPPAVSSEISTYRKWILVSVLSNAIIGNIDFQFLAHYHQSDALAYFAAAGRLTMPIQLLVMALSTTLLPKLSAVYDPLILSGYLRRISRLTWPLGLVIAASAAILPRLLVLLVGDRYVPAEPIMVFQIINVAIIFLTNPVSLILLAQGKAKGLAILNVVQMIVDLFLDWIWIPRYGPVGAVQATTVIFLMGFIYVHWAVFILYKNRRASS